jgi:predicted glutamine amidotransferase
MCGIVAVMSKNGKRASKAVIKRYRKQSQRGKSGFGFVSINEKGYIEDHVRTRTEELILSAMSDDRSPTIVFHHRSPTSTENYSETAHPFLIDDERLKYKYYIIHNGVISNWEALYEEYKKDGYKFLTEHKESNAIEFTNIKDSKYEFDPEIKILDSEALGIDLARFIEGQQTSIKSIGTISFIAVQCEKDGKVKALIYGHNDGNPLIEEKDKTLFCLRSVAKEGGGIKALPVDRIYTLDWATQVVTYQDVPVGYRRTTWPRKVDSGKDDDREYGGMGFDATKVSFDGSLPFRFLDRTHPLLEDGSRKSSIQIGPRHLKNNRHRDAKYDRMHQYNPDTDGWNDERSFEESLARLSGEVEEIIDCGPPEDEATEIANAADEILASLTDDFSDTERAKQLRRELESELSDQAEARDELIQAQKLLREAVEGRYATSEVDLALATCDAARDDYTAKRRVAMGTMAELSIYTNEPQN